MSQLGRGYTAFSPHQFLYNQKGTCGCGLRSATGCVDGGSQRLLFCSGGSSTCSDNEWENVKLLQSCFRRSECSGNANVGHICYMFCTQRWFAGADTASLCSVPFSLVSSFVLFFNDLWLVQVCKMIQGSCSCWVTCGWSYKMLQGWVLGDPWLVQVCMMLQGWVLGDPWLVQVCMMLQGWVLGVYGWCRSVKCTRTGALWHMWRIMNKTPFFYILKKIAPILCLLI